MDNLTEYLISKKLSSKEKTVRASLWLIAFLLVATLAFLLLTIYTFLVFAIPFIIILVFYFVRNIDKMFTIEFEYVLTNQFFDADRIINKSERSNIVSFSITAVDSIGRYEKGMQVGSNCKNKYSVYSSPDSPDLWYVTFDDEDKGRTLLVFEPNQKMLQHMKQYISSRVSGNVLREIGAAVEDN